MREVAMESVRVNECEYTIQSSRKLERSLLYFACDLLLTSNQEYEQVVIRYS